MPDSLTEILSKFESEMDSNPMAIIEAVHTIRDSGFGAEAIDPMLLLLEKYPKYDWGCPGHFASYMEKFSEEEYDDKLIMSMKRKPTVNTAFLLYRCANGAEKYLSAFKEILEYDDIDEDIKELITEYLEWLEEE